MYNIIYIEREVKQMNTKHYTDDRRLREEVIQKIIGEGEEFQSFVVDRGHRNGPEIHTITTTGIIIIRNARTNKTVTKLIARPNQIRRYFNQITEETQKIIDIAFQHTQLKYNMI